MPTMTFNMLCKPTILQYVPWTTNKALRTSIRPLDHLHRHSIKQHAYDREHCHSYLQFVHRTTNTTNETFNTFLGPSTLTLRLETIYSVYCFESQTTSVSLRRPPPPLKYIVHAYDYQRYHSCLERPYTIAPALRPPGRLWDQTHTQFDK